MAHQNRKLAELFPKIALGASVAEQDTLLDSARVETSAFADLINDRVDLIPGTKGSGKSALFRIFVDFLPDFLLERRKVVVAHGIQSPGDPVFNAYYEQFSKLTEQEFVNFWCIYLVSLAQEQFIKGARYRVKLKKSSTEIETFKIACAKARIPEIQSQKSLKDILGWVLNAISTWRPNIKYRPPDGSGEWELDLFGGQARAIFTEKDESSDITLPLYVNEIKETLETVLSSSNLSLWLMVDRLDEIFPRRSDLERIALRGLLRAMRYFSSPIIRVKVFLRDDMLEQVVRSKDGFTALTHITVRQADRLQWTQDQILDMVVKRFFSNNELVKYLKVNKDQLDASASYRNECFNKLFPPAVFRGIKQSPTIRWICNRCADGRGVVTPRDVLDLLIRAMQKQQDICSAEPEGTSEYVISASAIQYGQEELSKRKRFTYLEAEFPHLWEQMKKYLGGKTDYNVAALQIILGSSWKTIMDDFLAIGFFSKRKKNNEDVFSIPYLYRFGMNLTQGKA